MRRVLGKRRSRAPSAAVTACRKAVGSSPRRHTGSARPHTQPCPVWAVVNAAGWRGEVPTVQKVGIGEVGGPSYSICRADAWQNAGIPQHAREHQQCQQNGRLQPMGVQPCLSMPRTTRQPHAGRQVGVVVHGSGQECAVRQHGRMAWASWAVECHAEETDFLPLQSYRGCHIAAPQRPPSPTTAFSCCCPGTPGSAGMWKSATNMLPSLPSPRCCHFRHSSVCLRATRGHAMRTLPEWRRPYSRGRCGGRCGGVRVVAVVNDAAAGVCVWCDVSPPEEEREPTTVTVEGRECARVRRC